MQAYKIEIKGRVQGVGFRPFVYNLALSLGIKGTVANTASGVEIYACGQRLDEFIHTIKTSPPSLASIHSIEISPIDDKNFEDFSIAHSIHSSSFTHISPDMSICSDCLEELFDPTNRRYLHPFINCTNCGPRYSITLKVPYDRINTTMAKFTMCPQCLAEYKDIANRRFHAQPICCHECGPTLELVYKNNLTVAKNLDAIVQSISLLRNGAIVAIKGIGGFHLACDALNDEAVSRLRLLKRKSNKPFAVMLCHEHEIAKYCHMQGQELSLVKSMRRPIVLLKKKPHCNLSPQIAPNNSRLGVFLPYTPLHYLIFYFPLDDTYYPHKPHFSALVMTSANIAEEPIIKDNEEAVQKLSFIADAFLLHDRDIFMRVDDTVLKLMQVDTQSFVSQFIRRARGYVPEAIKVPHSFICSLGAGAELKNTFTIIQQDSAIMSQHIGDMQSLQSLQFFEETLQNLTSVYNCKPEIICHDLHPEYMTTKWASGQACKTVALQHHYSHIASVMAEHGITETVIGIAFDGTGLGLDESIWGSEFMIADMTGFFCKGRFKPIALVGGDMAVRETFRIAIAVVLQLVGSIKEALAILQEIGFVQKYGFDRVSQILSVASKKELCIMSSGAGRYFDAVSALLGISDTNTFEGECAMALEHILSDDAVFDVTRSYPLVFIGDDFFEIDFCEVFRGVLSDIKADVPDKAIAHKFHNTIIAAICNAVDKLYNDSKITKVCLSGGVFQNDYITRHCYRELRQKGFAVYLNQAVPPNDACISLGQAYAASFRLLS